MANARSELTTFDQTTMTFTISKEDSNRGKFFCNLSGPCLKYYLVKITAYNPACTEDPGVAQ
jgi:hypothetical protein